MKHAPLSNMALCLNLIEELQNLPSYLPRMGGFFGKSGIGKTVAAGYASGQSDAIFIRATSTINQKWFLKQLLIEVGVPKPKGTLAELTTLLNNRLLESRRPLIIDEADYIIKKSFIDLIRDLHDGSEVPILLIGEEYLSDHLEMWERFHNRMKFVPASLPTSTDILTLRDFYQRDGVHIADDLALFFADQVDGSIRRLAMNLHEATERSLREGWDTVDRGKWGGAPVMTGKVDHTRRLAA
ncbi:MAG: AAA family ATPase [Sphingomonadales bacterium]